MPDCQQPNANMGCIAFSVYTYIPISMSFPCPRSLFVPRLNITISPAQINAQKASE